MLFGSTGRVEPQHEDQMSAEDQALIMEAAILDTMSPDEVGAFLENHTEVQAALRDEVLLEKTIVRLDKQARLSQAQKTAVFTVAKERNDPLMKKLLTVWRMERFLESSLLKKYGNEGMRRAKVAVNNSSKSKSKVVKSVADKVKKQLNGSKMK
jgi:hypothetical protein